MQQALMMRRVSKEESKDSKAMSKAGWAKDGVWTPTAAFFVKGAYMIGALTNKDGRTFTLMGS